MNVKSLVCNSNGLACEVVATLSRRIRRWPSSKESESLFRRCCRSIEQLSNFFLYGSWFFPISRPSCTRDSSSSRKCSVSLEFFSQIWSRRKTAKARDSKCGNWSSDVNIECEEIRRKDCYLKKPLIICKNFVFLRTFLLIVNRSRNSFSYSQYANPLANLWFSICKVQQRISTLYLSFLGVVAVTSLFSGFLKFKMILKLIALVYLTTLAH